MIKIILSGFTRYFKKRKNLTFVIIFITAILLFFLSMMNTMRANFYDYWALELIGGDVAVSDLNKYFDLFKIPNLQNSFNYKEIVDLNKSIEEKMSPRIKTGVVVSSTKQESGILLYGVDFDKEGKLNKIFDESQIEGRLPRMGTNEIILPYDIMYLLGLEIGDKVGVQGATKDNYVNAGLYTVVGLNGLSDSIAGLLVNSKIGYMPIDTLQEFVCLDENQINQILFTDLNSIEKLFIDLPGLKYFSGGNVISFSRSISLAIKLIQYLVYFLLIVFLFIIIYHNISILNNTRKKEIGVYLTFGGNKSFVRKIMVLEFAIYLIFCLLIGLILGGIFIYGFNSLDIRSFDPVTEVLLSVNQFDINVSSFSFVSTILLLFTLSIFVSFVCINKYLGNIEVRTLFSKM